MVILIGTIQRNYGFELDRKIMAMQDLVGKVFGRLTVIKKAPSITIKNGDKRGVWECECSCGEIVFVQTNKLNSKWTKSCGCLKVDKARDNAFIMTENHRQFDPKIASARTVWRRYHQQDPECDIGFDDFLLITQMNCFYCDCSPANKFNKFLAPSVKGSIKGKEEGLFCYNGLDRFDNNNKNHTLLSVVPCCSICNYSKNDRELSIFIKWANNLTIKNFIPLDIGSIPMPVNRLLRQSIKMAFHNIDNTDLTIEEFYFISQINCFYCEIEPSNMMNRGKGYVLRLGEFPEQGDFKYNGIDRIDSNKLHMKDNIVPCCKYCNRAKSDFSLTEFQDWIRRIQLHIAKENTPLQLLLQKEKEQHTEKQSPLIIS